MTRKEYHSLLEEAGIYKKVFVTEEEARQHEEVLKTPEQHFYILDQEDDLTAEEIKIALLAKQTLLLTSIKAMLMFFTVLTVVVLVISVIAWRM